MSGTCLPSACSPFSRELHTPLKKTLWPGTGFPGDLLFFPVFAAILQQFVFLKHYAEKNGRYLNCIYFRKDCNRVKLQLLQYQQERCARSG